MPRLTAALLLLLASAPALAGEILCCQEPGSGRRVCGDTLPQQCRGQSYRVLDGNGNLLREVGPPLTPEQKAQKALEAQQRKELEAAEREQRRKDQALLDTYATPQDIDLAQKKAEADLNNAITGATAQIDIANGKLKKLDGEAEFYKKKTMPAELAKQIEAIRHEISVQQDLVDAKKRDFDTVRKKYDGDRKRYFELTGGRAAGGQPRPR